jgi:lipopolysaccharide/colanic/teichoic acid biosynthesis glycosyltransferase
VIIAPIIYFEDRGTIFYNAYRMGKDGKIFTMYKLRSMKVDAPDLRNEDGSTFNAENDQRLTKIGKLIRETSLDELPQIINIIKGDMSIIGPRPDLPEHEAFYENNEHRKLEIRPGLTGYNQAYFRNTIQWKDRIKNDIYYIDNMSAWMDLKIFFKTVKSVICRKDVFIKNNDESKNGDKNNVK